MSINFSVLPEVLSAIASVFLLPIYHIIILCIFSKRNIRKYSVSVVISFFLTISSWILFALVFSRIRLCNIFFGEVTFSVRSIVDSILTIGLFFIGYVVFFGLIRRGYTLQMLRVLYLGNIPMAPKEILTGYSNGKGPEWLLNKRLSGLVKNGLIKINGEYLSLPNIAARLFAHTIHFMARILGIRIIG